MDDFCEQEHQAWLDEQNAVVSFHEIPEGAVLPRAGRDILGVHSVAARPRVPRAVTQQSCKLRTLRYNKGKTAGGTIYDRTCM